MNLVNGFWGKRRTEISGTVKKTLTAHRIKDNLELSVLVLPAIIFFLIFHYIPIFGIILAFKSYRYDLGIFGSKWIGLDNFKFFFTSQDAWRVTRNTVGYSFLFILTGILSAVIVALLLFELHRKLHVKIYQTIMILPRFLSWVIVSYISYIFLNPVSGVFNQILSLLGREPVSWYSETVYWPFILLFFNTWKHVGLDCIIYYAALMSIDNELFEAAKIDGANKWQQIRHISLPALVPIITIMGILAVGSIFKGDFGLFYQIPRDVGFLYPVTDIIDTYIYRGLRKGDIGQTTAVGLFQSLVGLILIITTNWIVKKVRPENALF